MYKLYENYKEIVEETLLGEVRQSFDSLPTSVGLINNNYDLILLDVDKFNDDLTDEDLANILLGQITLDNIGNSLYEVDNVSAVKGYGLLMYELAMQYIYPNQLVSARNGDTSDAALRMYNYFLQGLNPNVKVETLQTPEYDDFISFEIKDKSDDFLTIYNSRFSMKPTNIQELLKKGDEIWNTSKNHLRLNKRLTSASYLFFKKKYKLEK